MFIWGYSWSVWFPVVLLITLLCWVAGAPLLHALLVLGDAGLLSRSWQCLPGFPRFMGPSCEGLLSSSLMDEIAFLIPWCLLFL